MYLNDYEEKIIDTFMGNLNEYENEEMSLIWKDGSALVATFDTCFEDENEYDMDDPRYEEFTSFAFTAILMFGKPPVYITEDKGFLIDYHNFPEKIIARGKKIN